MTDTDTPPPEPTLKPAKRPLWDRISIVWIVPFLALAVVIAIAWQSYADRGPLIEIGFDNASGIRAGNTELRFRDVRIGLVEEVTFAEGLGKVLIKARIDKDVAPYVDADAQFWVVRPQVTAQGVSGLGTVLSGVYIEGLWDDQSGETVTRFDGLPDAPLERVGQSGLRLTMRASDGAALTENTPILYRGVQVGRVGKPVISDDGTTSEADAVIFAPP